MNMTKVKEIEVNYYLFLNELWMKEKLNKKITIEIKNK